MRGSLRHRRTKRQKPPVFVLRRLSAAQRARVEEPAVAPEPVAPQTNVDVPPIVAAQTITAPRALEPKPARSREVERAAAHAMHARAVNTRRSYGREWEGWEAYASEHGASALPASPLVVAAYMAHLDAEGGLAPSSLDVAMAAITHRHRAARVTLPSNDPVVRDVRAGIRARRGTRPRAKAALSPSDLRAMIEALPEGLLGARDRALLLVGFPAALRRAELMALHVDHVSWHREGIIVHVARSKTDQLGEGADVPVHAAGGSLCPVQALRTWLDVSKIVGGPIFRRVDRWGRVGAKSLTGRAVALIVKKAAERAGLDAEELAGHSLRAGFATTAARAGANLAEIGRVTRHASEGMIRRYIRQGTGFESDPLRGVLQQ
jgi:integrase